MKKKLLLLLTVIGLFTCLKVSAQDKDSIVTLPVITVTSINKVNDQVNKAFKKSFPNAKRLHWYRLNKDYLATFIKDDMKHQSLFQKNGYIKYDVSYGSLFDLPSGIHDQVTGAYKGYDITKVAKVSRYNQDFWIINLEGIKDFVVVRAENNDLEEVKRIDKSEREN